MTQTFDRSQLDGKDREQLSQIATALGLKSISRMRKAELVDAIVQAGGAAPAAPRKVRSARASDDAASTRAFASTATGRVRSSGSAAAAVESALPPSVAEPIAHTP